MLIHTDNLFSFKAERELEALIRSLLELNPGKRPTALDARSSPFFHSSLGYSRDMSVGAGSRVQQKQSTLTVFSLAGSRLSGRTLEKAAPWLGTP